MELKMGPLNAMDRGRATTYLERLNVKLILNAGARRQGRLSASEGARPPSSLAAGPVTLAALVERGVDINAEPNALERPIRPEERVTPLGYKTALRRVPAALARLDRNDVRHRAALIYVDAHERLGAVAGQDFGGSSGGGGRGVPDGGAAARAEYARLLSAIRFAVNGWPRSGAMARGPLVLLAPGNSRGDRVAITAEALLDGVLIEGLAVSHILTRAGWSTHSHYVRRLNGLFLELLELMVGVIFEENWPS